MIQVQVLGCKQKSKQIHVYNKSNIIFKRQLPSSGKPLECSVNKTQGSEGEDLYQ